MKTYTIYFEATASQAIEVEADDYEDAIERSWDKLDTTLCYQCSNRVDLGDFEPAASFYVDGEFHSSEGVK